MDAGAKAMYDMKSEAMYDMLDMYTDAVYSMSAEADCDMEDDDEMTFFPNVIE